MTIECQVNGMCSGIYYPPNVKVDFILRIDNLSNKNILISNLKIEFSFMTYTFQNISYKLNQGEVRQEHLSFILSSSLSNGRVYFTLSYDLFYFDNPNWKYYQNYQIQNPKFFIEIRRLREINTSNYRVFLSKSNKDEDKLICNLIANRVEGWNIQIDTVENIEDYMASEIIRDTILKSDALIAIATPRNKDELTQTWKTLNWLHNEVGIAYGRNKPLLIIQENTVELDALPDYLTTLNGIPRILFNRNNQEQLLIGIDNYIPYFRHIIKNKLNDDFVKRVFHNVGSIVAGITIYEISKKLFDNTFLNLDY